MNSIPKTEGGCVDLHESEVVFMVLGRMLTDRGYWDLFRVDPQRVAASLQISLTSNMIGRLRHYLERLDELDLPERAMMSSQLNSVERSKQT